MNAIVVKALHITAAFFLTLGLLVVGAFAADAYHLPLINAWAVAHGSILIIFPLYFWGCYSALRPLAEGVKDGGKETSLVGNATPRGSVVSLDETPLEQQTMREDARMRTLRLSAKEWLKLSSMTHADLVPCEVSAPVRDVGEVMAELIRIGCWIQDSHDRDSRTLIWVGIPYNNLILFEKWLSRTFRGNATSTLLPINKDP